MTLSYKLFIARKLAIVVLVSMFIQLVTPVAAFALTSGPATPEFSSFEPVAANNMVDVFSGDFTYNIPILEVPGAHGGGYAMSLSYHSGASMEEEASWVGYGWTLNPGAINRSRQGFADDWNGVPIKYYNKTKPNTTVSAKTSVSAEFFSMDASNPISNGGNGWLGLSLGYGVSYNNYKGFRWSADLGLNVGGGIVSLGYSVNNSGDYPFSLGLNPIAILESQLSKAIKAKNDAKTKDKTSDKVAASIVKSAARVADAYGMHALNPTKHFTSGISRFHGINLALEHQLLPNSGIPAGLTPGIRANYSSQTTDDYTNKTYGYMYTKEGNNAPDADNIATDYRVDKNTPYDVRNPFIGAPINNADSYTMTGEGALGGFRVYNRSGVGFHPRRAASTTAIVNGGINIEVGGDIGAGTDFKVGLHSVSIQPWTELNNANHVQNATWNNISDAKDTRENNFFRFDGDMADAVFCGETFSTALQSAALGNSNLSTILQSAALGNSNAISVPNFSQRNGCKVEPFGTNNPEHNKRIRRSAFIDYNTAGMATENAYKYAKDDIVEGYIGTPDNNNVDRNKIQEFATTNKDGMTYIYGLPVLSRNEVGISYNASAASTSNPIGNPAQVHGEVISNCDFDNFNSDNGTETGNGVLTETDSDKIKTKMGQIAAEPYATTYLLTAITTPDYQDRTGDGPTDDDFGGYTRFVYDRAYGGNGNWYKWRMPYNGFLFQKNAIHNNEDDLITANWGEKEVYYLRYIETKTHVAVFDLSERSDGKGACNPEDADNDIQCDIPVYKLDKITLFAKKNVRTDNDQTNIVWNHSTLLNDLLGNINALGNPSSTFVSAKFEPIKSVHFDYDYELCQDLPNSTEGKLTLKRVWTEYKNIASYTISPYKFGYSYPDNNTDFQSVGNDYNFGNYGAGLENNPPYKMENVDAWQNYQINQVGATDEASRRNNMQTWVNQNPPTNFDPAAWQLKEITLPSGGQILVQYEQDDYSYVQDKLAHAMVPCSTITQNDDLSVTVDLTDIASGTLSSADDISNLVKSLYDPNTTVDPQKMYLKFLYKLFAANGECKPTCEKNEYIEGYANVKTVTVSTSNDNIMTITFDGNHMKSLCDNYLRAEANHLSTNPNGCAIDYDILSSDDGSNIVDAIESVVGNLASWVPFPTCGDVCPANSYVRIPIRNKKGGGVRVKRLLTYDPNTSGVGYNSLFGSEYIYKTIDEKGKLISSGVATNEPNGIENENILISFIPRFTQGWLNKMIAGKDKEVLEGPIGESLLPPPSVGYSQVIVRNIHGGGTNPGFSINTFYTAKDYPFKADWTELDVEKTYIPIYGGIFNSVIETRKLAQGFKFEINEMHGKPKETITYSGAYYVPELETLAAALSGNNLGEVVSSSTYTYFEPGEKLPTITAQTAIDPRKPDFFSSSSTWDGLLHQAAEKLPLGQEVDVTIEDKKVVDDYSNVGGEFDFNWLISTIIPTPLPIFAPDITFNKNTLKTHATTKVIHYPAVVKSVKTVANGLSSVTENCLFNRETGDPIVTITYTPNTASDPVPYTDRGYVSYNFPASMQYANMSQKAKNARSVFTFSNPNGVSLPNNTPLPSLSASLFFGTGTGVLLWQYFSRGDLLCFSSAANPTQRRYVTVTSVNANFINIINSDIYSSQGTGSFDRVEIIRSGNTNQLSAMAGSFTAYNVVNSTGQLSTPPGTQQASWTNSPPSYLSPVSPVTTITVTNVVAATASVYSDNADMASNMAPSNTWNYSEPSEYYFPYPLDKNPCSYSGANLYDLNKLGKWRLHSTFAYEASNSSSDGITALKTSYTNDQAGMSQASYNTYSTTYTSPYNSTSNCSDKNYEGGTYTLGVFNWRSTNDIVFNSPSSSPYGRWIRTNKITKYSPHGEPLEEENILGMKSCAKYGSNRTLPYLTAQNASYNDVYFESFENVYSYGIDNPSCTSGKYVEDECKIDPVTINNKQAHSGYHSKELGCTPATSTPNPNVFTIELPTQTNSYSVKFWVKMKSDDTYPHGYEPTAIETSLQVSCPGNSLPPTYLATSGEWHLFEKIFQSTGNSIITFTNANLSGFSPCPVYKLLLIDDIRIQPIDAQMNCYVYDNQTQQLLTTFDDQHFGTYYQYNEKGQLVRKIIETERGKKTVQENQYNTPKTTK